MAKKPFPNLATRTYMIDDITVHEQVEIPYYPSVGITIEPDLYNEAVRFVMREHNVPCTFYDGERIYLPEYEELVIADLEGRYGSGTEYGLMQEHEYATLAIRAQLNGEIVLIGDAIQGLDGTPQEMLEKALENHDETLMEWRSIYLSSMITH